MLEDGWKTCWKTCTTLEQNPGRRECWFQSKKLFYIVIMDLRLPRFCSRGVHVFQHVFQASSNIFQENTYNITRESRVPATHSSRPIAFVFVTPYLSCFICEYGGRTVHGVPLQRFGSQKGFQNWLKGCSCFHPPTPHQTTPNHTKPHHTTPHYRTHNCVTEDV